jgi:hypothetical protein
MRFGQFLLKTHLHKKSETFSDCFKHFAWSYFEASFQLAQAECLLDLSHKLRFAKLAAVMRIFPWLLAL